MRIACGLCWLALAIAGCSSPTSPGEPLAGGWVGAFAVEHNGVVECSGPALLRLAGSDAGFTGFVVMSGDGCDFLIWRDLEGIVSGDALTFDTEPTAWNLHVALFTDSAGCSVEAREPFRGTWTPSGLTTRSDLTFACPHGDERFTWTLEAAR